MPTPPSLNSILADKTPSDSAPKYPAPKPVTTKTETPTRTNAPEPLYTERPLEKTEYANWLAAGGVYALIDGLNLPDLAGQINQRYPGINTALYIGPFGEQHSAETPRFAQLDSALHDWLQPQIHKNPGWGWSMIPRNQEQRTPEQILNTLCEHYRPWSWATTPQGATWLFRLHDPRVLQNWLHTAPDDAIERFMAPLQQLIIHGAEQTIVLSPRDEPAPLHQALPMAPWTADNITAMQTIGQDQLLARFETHLITQHPGRLPDHPTERRGWIINQANKAYRHALRDEQSMIKYLSLSAVLGPDFDQGDTGAWARDILNGPAIQGTQHRIDRLIAAACKTM
jgi:hypothetical protein